MDSTSSRTTDAERVEQHTPGPWEVVDGDIISEGGAHVATVSDYDDFPCVEGAEEAVRLECAANARLIAAAPDMLAALIAMDALMENLWKAVPWGQTFNLDVQALNEAPMKARIAINRATAPAAERVSP